MQVQAASIASARSSTHSSVAPFLVGFGALATVAFARMDRLAARYDSDAHSGRVLLLFALALMNVWQLIFLVWMAFGTK